jgi:hypothetical protein
MLDTIIPIAVVFLTALISYYYGYRHGYGKGLKYFYIAAIEKILKDIGTHKNADDVVQELRKYFHVIEAKDREKNEDKV